MLQRVTIDAYGLMLSTKQTNYVQAIVKSVLDSGESFAFGHGPHFTVQDACLINGTAIHGEDFDDTFEGTPVHISSIIVPVIFAIGQKNNLSSDKMIQAMAAGSELILSPGVGRAHCGPSPRISPNRCTWRVWSRFNRVYWHGPG